MPGVCRHASTKLARRQMLLRTQSIHCSPRWSESVVAKSYKGQQPPVRAEPMLLSIEENQHEQALTCRGDYIARQLEPGLRRDCGGTDSRPSGRCNLGPGITEAHRPPDHPPHAHTPPTPPRTTPP